MGNNIKRINNPEKPYKHVLFLGYDRIHTRIINELMNKNCCIDHTDQPITKINDYDLIICYGYRHILKKELIHTIKCPIFNLHISYLPFNRGSHPNFWSFYDQTPSGVTIHLIDEGIDTGPILYQKYVNFDEGEITFEQTYLRLKKEIEKLFIENITNILSNLWLSKPQKGDGSVHYIKDLPKNFSGWKSNIKDEIKKLKKEKLQNEK